MRKYIIIEAEKENLWTVSTGIRTGETFNEYFFDFSFWLVTIWLFAIMLGMLTQHLTWDRWEEPIYMIYADIFFLLVWVIFSLLHFRGWVDVKNHTSR